jgi:DNA-binding response OmpR family regulator
MEAADTNTVLLVEGDAALRRVIAMGLRHQGMSVLEASSAQQARALLDQRPALLVVDVDSSPAGDRKLLPDLRAYDGLAETPAVVLAWDCSPDLKDQVSSDGAAVCLAKPFDARRLFAEAELLLEAALRRRAESAVAASVGSLAPAEAPNRAAVAEMAAEVIYAASRLPEASDITPTAAPSIWPFVLALGLMVAVSGLLIHPVLVALGVAIVLGSMLLWGFEPNARPGEA